MATTKEQVEQRQELADRFKELMAEISEKANAALEIVREASELGVVDGTFSRAECYWHDNIVGTVDGSACMHSMADTLKEIEGEDDEDGNCER